jgi:hypothetical protein
MIKSWAGPAVGLLGVLLSIFPPGDWPMWTRIALAIAAVLLSAWTLPFRPVRSAAAEVQPQSAFLRGDRSTLIGTNIRSESNIFADGDDLGLALHGVDHRQPQRAYPAVVFWSIVLFVAALVVIAILFSS